MDRRQKEESGEREVDKEDTHTHTHTHTHVSTYIRVQKLDILID